MTDFEVLCTVTIGKARTFIISITLLNGIRFEQVEKKKDEKFEKKILTLFERAGPGIAKEVEMS